MKKEIRDKWCAALRSGNYKQGETYLRRINESGTPEYCCLGVLCDITGENFVDNSLYRRYFTNSYDCICTVPDGFHGLTSNILKTLYFMNDGHNLPFPEIAQWIEENVPLDDTETP